MAGVKIPTVQRIAPQAPSSVGSVSAPRLDVASNVARTDAGVTNLLQGAADYATKVEVQTGKEKGRAAANEYDRWYNKKLNGDSETGETGLRFLQGDSTEAYNSFDKEAKEFRASLLSDNPNLSSLSKSFVKREVEGRHNSLYNKRIAVYGQQHAQYQDKLQKDTNELGQQRAVGKMIEIVPGDVKSLEGYNRELTQMNTNIVEHGLNNVGTVAEDKNGDYQLIDENGEPFKVKLGPAAQIAIAKNMSDTTEASIKSLLASKSVNKAQMMMDNYGDTLDEIAKPKITKAFEELKVDLRAKQEWIKHDGKPVKDKLAAISKIKDKDVRIKTLEIADAVGRHRAAITSQASTMNYNAADALIEARMSSKDAKLPPFTSWYEVTQNEAIAAHLTGISTPAQKKALKARFNGGPKTSDPDASLRALELRGNPDNLFNKTAAEINEFKGMLSKAEFGPLNRAWQDVRTQTVSQERARIRSVYKQLDIQLKSQGLFKKTRKGTVKKSDTARKSRLMEAISRKASQLPERFSVQEEVNWVSDIIADDQLQQRRLNDGAGFFETPGAPSGDIPLPGRTRTNRPTGDSFKPPKPPSGSGSYGRLSPDERSAVRKQYIKETGKRATSTGELSTWYDLQESNK